MRDFYTGWERREFLRARTGMGFLHEEIRKPGIVFFFFFGIALSPPLIMMPRVLRDRRTRFLLITGAVAALGLSANAWLSPHYVAPFTCAIYAILLQCMRHLRAWPGNQSAGLALVRIIPLVCLVLVGARMFRQPLGLSIPEWPMMWYGREALGRPRTEVAAALGRQPGPQLAIVRYSPGHPPRFDWVYNAADIDKSKVVWARESETGSNLPLLRYFSNRTVWLVEPDSHPPAVRPYPLQ
jgi:hypothetical protein